MDDTGMDNGEQGSTSEPYHRQPGGILVTRGMTIGIPRGGLTLAVGINGVIKSSVTFHVSLDVSPFWLEIALNHLLTAERYHADVLNAWRTPDDKRLAEAMEAEFTVCMQCIMAAAIAIDAFYAVVKRHIDLPEAVTRSWREKKTARHKQISEVMRRAFRIGPESTKHVRAMLAELLRFRDLAVHPSAQPDEPVMHPDLEVGTEWRFATFRLHNAMAAARVALALIAQMVARPNKKFANLADYCAGACARIDPLVQRWKAQYGELYPREKPSS